MSDLKQIRIEDQATLRMVKTVQEQEGHPTITQAARVLMHRGAGKRVKMVRSKAKSN